MDEARIGTLIENIYASAFGEVGWDSVLQTLRTEFHAASVTSLMSNKLNAAPMFAISTISDRSCANDFFNHYHAVDPEGHGLVENVDMFARRGVFPSSDLIPLSEYLNCEFYRDFGRRYDFCKGMTTIIGNHSFSITNIRLHRPLSGKDFTKEESERLATLAPHLNRGLRMYRELAGLRAKAGLFEAAFEALGAAFLLDASGRVLMLNRAAECMLKNDGVLCLVEGRLGARQAADDAVLAAAFAPMLPGAAPAEIVLRGGAMAVGLQLAITPVKGRNIPLFANALHGERVAFMVTATALGPSLQNLMALYGLTRAEAEVTLLLTEGLRAPQIALHRETSTATVNTQLKQIYAKTGVDGQIALILKLLGR
jgi:DNA-binding CsgD family transcriptional regulator